ncbi:MAG: hypothetical protein RL701_686, partial [Pseudomonadota bacterium]
MRALPLCHVLIAGHRERYSRLKATIGLVMTYHHETDRCRCSARTTPSDHYQGAQHMSDGQRRQRPTQREYYYYFYWVAKLESITQAAKRCGISQAAMSGYMAHLEELRGVQLFEREPFLLTSDGERFLRLVLAWQQVEERLDTFGPAAQRTLPLRMGVIESVLFSWGTPWIRH